MGEIRGPLLTGGMVFRNLESRLTQRTLDSESWWTESLWVDSPQLECLQPEQPYRLELKDDRAGQIEVTHIECVPGHRRMRAVVRGCSAHAHHTAISLIPAAIFGDAYRSGRH